MSKTFNPSKYANTVQGAAIVLCDPRSSAANQFFGATAISSTTLVISTTVVKSDSLIFLSAKASGAGMGMFVVNSVTDKASFTVQGSFITAGSGTLFWEIKNIK